MDMKDLFLLYGLVFFAEIGGVLAFINLESSQITALALIVSPFVLVIIWKFFINPEKNPKSSKTIGG